jgi:hypothetical protein
MAFYFLAKFSPFVAIEIGNFFFFSSVNLTTFARFLVNFNIQFFIKKTLSYSCIFALEDTLCTT